MNKKPPVFDTIKSVNDINKIRNLLYNKPRDLLLFEMGVGTGIRINQLLELHVSDLLKQKLNTTVNINIKNYTYSFVLNEQIYHAFTRHVNENKLNPDDYLFLTRNKVQPLSPSTVSNMVKAWAEEAGLHGHFGSQSLLKTWQYLTKNNPDNEATVVNSSLMNIEPIEKQPVQNQILDRLYQGIITGNIPPGTKLSAVDLSKQFKVSLSPVRTALLWLESQGFVTASKKKACIVKKLTYEGVVEIFTIRMALEAIACEKAFENLNPKTIAKLEHLIKKAEKLTDWMDYMIIHKQFHLILYRDSHMQLLLDYINNLHDRTHALFLYYYSSYSGDKSKKMLATSISKHKEILKYVKNNDKENATSFIKRDIMEAQEKIGQFILKEQESEQTN